jgi:cytochrome c556
MKRMVTLLLVLALACLVVNAPPGAGQEKTLGIKDIMGKANKPTGIYFSMARELKEDKPDWAELKKQSKELADLAAVLTKTKPPKGDAASWQQLTTAYADSARALDAAVGRMDKNSAAAAHARMGGNACNACHKAHRE